MRLLEQQTLQLRACHHSDISGVRSQRNRIMMIHADIDPVTVVSPACSQSGVLSDSHEFPSKQGIVQVPTCAAPRSACLPLGCEPSLSVPAPACTRNCVEFCMHQKLLALTLSRTYASKCLPLAEVSREAVTTSRLLCWKLQRQVALLLAHRQR
jgi:hypothetical protein